MENSQKSRKSSKQVLEPLYIEKKEMTGILENDGNVSFTESSFENEYRMLTGDVLTFCPAKIDPKYAQSHPLSQNSELRPKKLHYTGADAVSLRAAAQLIHHLRGISEELKQVPPPILNLNLSRTKKPSNAASPILKRQGSIRERNETAIKTILEKLKQKKMALKPVLKTPKMSPRPAEANVAMPRIAHIAPGSCNGFGNMKKLSIPDMIMTPIGSDMRSKRSLAKSASALQIIAAPRLKRRRKILKVRKLARITPERRIDKITELYKGSHRFESGSVSPSNSAFIYWTHNQYANHRSKFLNGADLKISPRSNPNLLKEKVKVTFHTEN